MIRIHMQFQRRGVALLIVLGVLMISVTAATIMLSAATDVHVQRDMAEGEMIAFELFTATEEPIQFWLEHDSAKAVVPPDAHVPAVAVLDDRWSDEDGHDIRVRISAFDQLGMVPMQLARSGSPLRLTLPSTIMDVIDRLDLPPLSDPTPLGLDLVEEEVLGVTALVDSQDVLQVYPRCISAASDSGVDSPEHLPDGAVGGFVATHNRDPVRININTAPQTLLEAALREVGNAGGAGVVGGAIEAILATRAEGKAASVGGQLNRRVTSQSRETSNLIRLVTSSDCWSFRIDLDIDNLRRSWWVIYQTGPDDPNTPQRERWRCVQRLAITQ